MATKPEDKRPEKPKTDRMDQPARGGGLGPTKDAHRQHRTPSPDELLDEALEGSFPASDPPAQTVPVAREDKTGRGGKQ